MNVGKLAIVLPGGGFKCAFQAGGLLAIEELGLPVLKLQGVSGGALNAAQFVAAGASALETIWKLVEKSGPHSIFRRWDVVRNAFQNAIYSGQGLDHLLSQLDVSRLIESSIECEIVVWDELLEQNIIVSNRQFSNDEAGRETIRHLIKASSCFPGLLPPEAAGSQVYSDGCEIFLDHFADFETIIIIDTSQPHLSINPLKLIWYKRLKKRFSTLLDSCINRELAYFAMMYKFRVYPDEYAASLGSMRKSISASLIDFAKDMVGLPLKRLVLIRPSINIPTLMLDSFQQGDFKKGTPGDITKAIQHGRECTREMLEKVFTG